ncbi:MAG TPA: sugar phosphate isomerase/epimerase [Planctomycetota bacterium]|jgi:sugar phosphate isomerase/epimerase
MRLGGPVFEKNLTPESWLVALGRSGYGAAYCPVDEKASDDVVRGYVQAAAAANIVIAEVGAWSNTVSPDAAAAKKNIEFNQARLALAERVGARCCVNITGSRGTADWAGPHKDNLTQETFDLIVETVRKIIDFVKPTRTFYTLETMQWMYPDSADNYLRLIKAIDRPRCAAHFDPTNLVTSPQIYFNTGAMIRDAVAKLGPYIRSCHAKDVKLANKAHIHMDEIRPGEGNLDYTTYLKEIDKLDPDMPLMLEHLPNAEQYDLAAKHIRGVAKEAGLSFKG